MEINDVGKIITGKTPPTKNPEYYGSLMPFLTPSDIKTRKYVEKTERSLSNEGIKLLTSNILPPNSIAVTCIGSIGKIVYIKKHTITNQQINSVIPNKLIDPEFLYYFFKNNKKLLKNLASGGSVVPILKKSLFSKIQIDVFVIQLQRKIGKILSDLDNKIENLHNQNIILNQISQAIFKSWFVDFDGITEFEDSELGRIPKMWRIVKLSDFITLQKGISYKGKYLANNGNPLINLGNISKNGVFINHKIKYYTGKFKTRHTINSHDIVIANTDITQDRLVLGSATIIPPLNQKTIIFTHHLFGVINHSKLGNYFLYNLFQTIRYRQNVTSYAIGTTVLAIPKEAVLDFKFPFIKGNIFQKFEKIAASIYKLIINNNMKIENLIKMRDTLLPKLMS